MHIFKSVNYLSPQIPDKFWCPDRILVEDNQVKHFELPTLAKEVSLKIENSKKMTISGVSCDIEFCIYVAVP